MVCVGVVVVDRHGGVLRRFLAKRRAWRPWVGAHGRRQEAYNVRVEFGAEVYDSTRVHRTDAMWYYEGVTHEYLPVERSTNALQRALHAPLHVTHSHGRGIFIVA